jgi:cytochrome c1
MTKRLTLRRLAAAALLAGPIAAAAAGSAHAAGDAIAIPRQKWPFAGMLGHYDQAQLQRGFQVFQEKCALCHNMRLVKFRNLGEPGGPVFSEAVVKELAKAAKFSEVNDKGDTIQREGRPTDPIILWQFANDQQARSANSSALPPDFSVLAKARGTSHNAPWYIEPLLWLKDIVTGYQEGGVDYIYALMTSYGDAPAYREQNGKLIVVPAGQAGANALRCATVDKGDKALPDTCNKLADGMSYNAAFPGHQIAMPPPMAKDNFVKYGANAGATGSLEQNAKDVASFMMWASEPHLDARKRTGVQVVLFLGITALLLWLAKRRLWAKIEH